MSTAKTTTKEQRATALQDRLHEIDRDEAEAFAALDTARDEVQANATAARTAAHAAAKEAYRQALQAFVKDARAVLAPFPAQWTEQPSRALATKLGSELALLIARESAELGPSSSRARAVAILGNLFVEHAAQKHPGILAVFSRFGEMPAPTGIEKWVTALRDVERATESPSRMETALRAVEDVIEDIAQSTGNDRAALPAELRIRWRLLREHDHTGESTLSAFDRARAQAKYSGKTAELADLIAELGS